MKDGKRDPSAASPGGPPGFLLWRASMRWQRALRAELAGLGLTHVQFLLLASLCRLEAAEGAATQARLAEHAQVDPMMASQVLRAMERKGWLQRRDHPEDARAFLLCSTARGRALHRRAAPRVEAADARFFGALGKDPRPFLAALDRLKG